MVRAAAAVRCLGPLTPPAVATRFWLTYARLGLFSTRSDCFDAAERAADLARAAGDTESLYEALLIRAGIGARRHEFATAHAALIEAGRIEDPAWTPNRRALRAFGEWILALQEGRIEDARGPAMRRVELFRASGDARGEQLALGNVALLDVFSGRPESAAQQLRSVIAELERIGAGDAAGHMVQNLATALLALGDAEQALTVAHRSYTLLRREGDHASLLPLLARIAAARGDSRTALKVAGYTLKRFYWSADRLRVHWGLSDARLAPDVPPAERAALITEGEQLGEEEAIRLVLAKGGGAGPR